MESMSAKYLRAYGGEGLTPNLDHLLESGLTFDHTYATGTRTVRGIEAVLLSLPPTPGQSIVRRPHSENLFSLGSVLKDHGYDLSFIYGGHAMFDNMREFYESNSFAVLDKGDFSSDQVQFSNAWGICDEDVFHFAVDHANQLHKESKPFFEMILTTSNHRPYTFPDGKVSRPSGEGREAAIRVLRITPSASSSKKPLTSALVLIKHFLFLLRIMMPRSPAAPRSSHRITAFRLSFTRPNWFRTAKSRCSQAKSTSRPRSSDYSTSRINPVFSATTSCTPGASALSWARTKSSPTWKKTEWPSSPRPAAGKCSASTAKSPI